MASFETRGNSVRAKVRLNGHTKTGTFDTQQEAETWAANLETAIRNRDPRATEPDAPFGDWLKRYINEVAKTWTTGNDKISRLTWVKEQAIAKVPVTHLTPAHFETLKQTLYTERGLKPQTVRHYLQDCSAVWTAALKTWKVTRLANPLHEIEMPPVAKGRKNRVRDGLWEDILASLRKHVNPFYPLYAEFLFETAMRVHEGLLIRKRDVDREDFLLDVTGKGDADRKVPLSPRAMELIDEALELRKKTPARFSARNGGYFDLSTFAEDAIWPLSYSGFYRAWKGARHAAGDDHVWIHDLRRERATRLMDDGWDTTQVALVTGHKDLRTLNEHYLVKEVRNVAKRLRASAPVDGADPV